MRLLFLSFKSIFENPLRSLTLGFFIFIITLLMGVASIFFYSVETNMQDSINHAFTGDLLIRSADNKEGNDIFTMKGQWGITDKLSSADVQQISDILDQSSESFEYTSRVRQNVLFANGDYRQAAMVIGLPPEANAYKNTLKLTAGEYLSANSGQVVISEAQAEKLQVSIGDKLEVMANVDEEQWVQSSVTVVGIGNLELLSSFQFPVTYMDLETSQLLTGYTMGEVTDIAVYQEDRSEATPVSEQLMEELSAHGLGHTIVSTWDNLSGYVMSTISIYLTMFNAFFVIMLIIVGILIINLIFMMGIERRLEIGTLRAIGFSRSQNLVIFQGEILMISIIALLLGTTIAGLIVEVLSHVGIAAEPPISYLIGEKFFPQLALSQLFSVAGIVLGFVLVASFYPCYKIASLKPIETINEN